MIEYDKVCQKNITITEICTMCDVGIRIKEARMRKNMTQKELAKRINRSETAVSSYESNVQFPPLDVLISIAKVLEISLDYLVGFNSNQTYSDARLTPKQKEVIELLFREFNEPTNTGTEWSAQQAAILKRLNDLFSERK